MVGWNIVIARSFATKQSHVILCKISSYEIASPVKDRLAMTLSTLSVTHYETESILDIIWVINLHFCGNNNQK